MITDKTALIRSNVICQPMAVRMAKMEGNVHYILQNCLSKDSPSQILNQFFASAYVTLKIHTDYY